MPHLRVAHVIDQGVEYLLVPVESSFAQKTEEEKRGVIQTLQSHAASQGLTGAVVPVWDAGGYMGFQGPVSFQPLFNDWTLQRVLEHLNEEIRF